MNVSTLSVAKYCPSFVIVLRKKKPHPQNRRRKGKIPNPMKRPMIKTKKKGITYTLVFRYIYLARLFLPFLEFSFFLCNVSFD